MKHLLAWIGLLWGSAGVATIGICWWATRDRDRQTIRRNLADAVGGVDQAFYMKALDKELDDMTEDIR